MNRRITILSGAGISAESGIRTFRDSDGLWEEHRIEDVATPEAWQRDPKLVLHFYNLRRKQLQEVEPNAAHLAITELQKKFDVQVITQNVDDLHERAGNSKVLHLHGELKLARSTGSPFTVYPIDSLSRDFGRWELNLGDLCKNGHQLRPHIVWFGEAVPKLETAAQLTSESDALIIVGTSLNVYPAASLYQYAKENCPIWIIDPKASELVYPEKITAINENAGAALPKLVASFLNEEIVF
ncbi:MAG: NAD-dependent deacylase [Flavobacteriales bacterium]|nr:NAD-dependent deacylase [Flavobacteriales bacterium]